MSTTDPSTTDDQTAQTEPAVPSGRLRQETDRRKAAEKRITELESRIEELAERDKPDIERLTKQVERLQQERDTARHEAEQVRLEAAKSERRSLVSETAAKLGFRDPSDATRFVDLDDIEDAASAERALKNVAKTKEYLLAPKTAEPKGLERLSGVGALDQAAAPTGLLTPDQLAQQHGRELYEAFQKAGVVPPPVTDAA